MAPALHGGLVLFMRRVKRASATDLYRTCKQAGTCPPDVIPKVEGTTLADRILQVGGSAIYLGGLGFTSTGKTTPAIGSVAGYTPLGPRDINVGAPRPTRPALPVDTLLPEVGLPVNELDPAVAAGALGNVYIAPDAPSVLPGVTVEELPLSDLPSSTAPSVVLDTGTGSLQEPVPEAVVLSHRMVSHSHHQNPLFVRPEPLVSGETSDFDFVIVHPDAGSGLSEGIELQPVVPRASTPDPRTTFRNPRFQSRAYTQRPLTKPAANKVFGFENPAYDPDYSFGVPSPSSLAEEFPDLQRLGRVHVGEARGGGVRLSRVGSMATIRTRAGTVIGERAHFYMDLSPVPTGAADPEVIPLEAFNVLGSEGVLPDEELLDAEISETSFGPLVMQGRGARTSVASAPTVTAVRRAFGSWLEDIGGVLVDHAYGDIVPLPPAPADTPVVVRVGEGGVTFNLHPSLSRKKRKRRRAPAHRH